MGRHTVYENTVGKVVCVVCKSPQTKTKYRYVDGFPICLLCIDKMDKEKKAELEKETPDDVEYKRLLRKSMGL